MTLAHYSLRYYLPYLDNIKAFPEGFRMLAGNPRLREFNGSFPDAELSSWPTDPTDQFFLQQRAIGFNCLNYQKAPEPSLYRHDLPTKSYLDANCADGLRLEMAFPSCGNGELDSDDHKSHILYPSLVKEGNCPKGYDIHYPFIFYETIWATNAFIGQDGEFVLSPGDPSGAGYHADFFMGWKSSDFLQQAIDECTNQSGQISDCPLFTLQSDKDAAKCTFDMPKELKNDDATGPCEGLPVGVPVQYGPEMATKYAVPGRDSASTSVAPKPPAPSTYSERPVAPYTSAAASLVSTALGGIVLGAAPGTDAPVAASQPTNMRAAHAVNSDSSSSPSPAAPSPATTPPPVAQPASNNKIIATSYITQGSEVIEVVIEQELVTTTATQVNQVYNKRHLHQHLHHNNKF